MSVDDADILHSDTEYNSTNDQYTSLSKTTFVVMRHQVPHEIYDSFVSIYAYKKAVSFKMGHFLF